MYCNLLWISSRESPKERVTVVKAYGSHKSSIVCWVLSNSSEIPHLNKAQISNALQIDISQKIAPPTSLTAV